MYIICVLPISIMRWMKHMVSPLFRSVHMTRDRRKQGRRRSRKIWIMGVLAPCSWYRIYFSFHRFGNSLCDNLYRDSRYWPHQKDTFANVGYSLKGDLNAWPQENMKVIRYVRGSIPTGTPADWLLSGCSLIADRSESGVLPSLGIMPISSWTVASLSISQVATTAKPRIWSEPKGTCLRAILDWGFITNEYAKSILIQKSIIWKLNYVVLQCAYHSRACCTGEPSNLMLGWHL